MCLLARPPGTIISLVTGSNQRLEENQGATELRHKVSDVQERRRAMSTREVVRVVTAHRQREGGGFLVRRPLPTAGLDHLDPFLLIDEGGPVTYGPGEAVGAPDHPHRGFETVTYILEGAFEH